MSFWSDRNVLVTGGAGFIGSHLVSALADAGAQVAVIDDLSKNSIVHRANMKGLPKNASLETNLFNLLDADRTKRVFNRINPSIVFHLAAKIGGIGYFHKSPADIIHDNLIIDSNVFDAVKQTSSVEKTICVSSSMVFESATAFPVKESDLSKIAPPQTSYGFSKLAVEYLARAYASQYGLNYVIARPFNCFGPNEAVGEYIGYSHVIPDLISKVFSGQSPLEILGSGEQTRSYTYVEDVASALLFLAEHCTNGDFNIGTGTETSVRELAELIWKLCGRTEPFTTKSVPAFEFDVQRRVPDITKISNAGWRARTSLDEGLSRTIQWFKEKRT